MGKKRSVGVFIGGMVVVILSLLSPEADLLKPFPFRKILNITNLGWMEVLPFLSRTDPFFFVLNPLGYYIAIFHLNILVSFLIVICSIFLFNMKNWARKFLIVYCWINIIFLVTDYFLKPLFIVGLIARLNFQTLSSLSKMEGFYTKYLQELNPANQGINSFLLNWILPITLYYLFIYFFTHPKVKEQFK